MKYVAILAVVVFIVRIDFWLGLIDQASNNLNGVRETPMEVSDKDIKSSREVIPVHEDASLKQTPKRTFLALLEDFHINPSSVLRERALVIFKSNPKMFTQKLDQELESHVFQWRDLLSNNEPEVAKFMLDLMNILQGENQEMVKRFFSLWMDINMEHFIAAYSKSKDTSCAIVTVIGDTISEEEKFNEYYERESALKSFVAKEKIDPVQMALAKNCLFVLGAETAKIPPKALPEEEAPMIDPGSSTDSSQGGVTP